MILRNHTTIERLNDKKFLQANKFNLNVRLTYHEFKAEQLESLLNKVFQPLREAGFDISVFVSVTQTEVKIRSNAPLKSVLSTLNFAYVTEKRFNTSKGVKYLYNIGYNTYI